TEVWMWSQRENKTSVFGEVEPDGRPVNDFACRDSGRSQISVHAHPGKPDFQSRVVGVKISRSSGFVDEVRMPGIGGRRGGWSLDRDIVDDLLTCCVVGEQIQREHLSRSNGAHCWTAPVG